MKPATPSASGPSLVDGPSTDRYLSLRTLAAYSGLSVRTLRDRLVHAVHPLPHYRVGGKILVKQSEFDAWIRTFRCAQTANQRELGTTLLRSL